MTSATDNIPAWAKIKAYREVYSNDNDIWPEAILSVWVTLSDAMHALARRIARDDTPPVPRELLIWREANARALEKTACTASATRYRTGKCDNDFYIGNSSVKEAIKLALEGFGLDSSS